MTLNQQPPARLTCKPEEAVSMLGMGRNSVYALIRSGRLRSIKVGRKILIPLSAIEEFLNGGHK
ncbi:excisionase [Deinococcus sp. RL]|uniref:helix-turn-helix domain-containing protein n=1 Tax=Deinococcus sp. RL TaxID=1489678 RepID=UPI0004D4FE04|nr:helix-turn-helix domain-containing protein [Deinococcus sp. RL]KEF34105.1 excisionase [Deinococcus sp. RL]